MTRRLRPPAFLLGLVTCGVVIGLAPAAASAQRSGTPTAPFILVTAFRTPDGNKQLAVRAADEMRTQLKSRISSRELYVIPKEQIEAYLEGSGYAKDEPLNAIDAKQLGQVLRADEILIGEVTPLEKGFKLRGTIALTRDMALRDPIAEAEGETMSQAAALFTRQVQEVRKQLSHERACNTAILEGDPAKAEASARAGIAAFPEATISRVCLVYAMVNAKKTPDEILAAVDDVLAKSPRHPRALAVAVDQYLAKGDTAKMAEVSSELVAVEAGNPRLVEQIVQNLESMRRADVALPILERALVETPEDPDLMRLQFRLLVASQRWKDVITKGEQLAIVDTASADQKFFERMAAAYQADSQPQKAAEVLARGVAKFPSDPMMQLTYGQVLQGIGQLPQAVEVLKKALEIEPKLPNARLLIARAYNEMGQTEQTLAALKDAAENGEDKATTSGYAATLANAQFRKARESQSIDDARAILPFAQLATEIDPENVNAKFLLGVGNFFMAQYVAQGLADLVKEDKAKACALVNEAVAAATQAQIYIPQGGRVDPNTAGQLLQVLPQISGYLEQQQPVVCR